MTKSTEISIRAACLLAHRQRALDLMAWSRSRRTLAIEPLWDASQLRARCLDDAPDLVLADAEHAAVAAEVLLGLESVRRPELVLVGVSSLEALRIRHRGLPLAIEMSEPLSLDELGRIVERVARARLPLRAIAADLIDCLDLPEAVALLRYYMLAAALCRAKTKRAAAKLLGVSRPAVQHLSKSFSMEAGWLTDASRESGQPQALHVARGDVRAGRSQDRRESFDRC